MSFIADTHQAGADLLKVCVKQNIPFAAYRIPQHQNFQIMVQHQTLPRKFYSIAYLQDAKGFVIAPFSMSKGDAIFLLEPDFILDSDKPDNENLTFLAGINSFVDSKKTNSNEYLSTSKTEFTNQVNAAKEAISRAQFHKVVLSKIRKEKLNANFDKVNFFLRLCEQYPSAFVSFIQLPEVGSWIGATPEQMLVSEDQMIKTESLAGTQKATNISTENYVWSEKEIREQAIVTDYVESTLRSANITNYQLCGPVNHLAGNLVHLKTSFKFQLNDSKSSFGDLLSALHPTPSVGGMPKSEACKFILTNEKHNRKYYAGFLGPINIENKTKLFVNLRCLQLFKNDFVLYSGAGITAGSDAAKEWEETENKMMTLMNVLGKIV